MEFNIDDIPDLPEEDLSVVFPQKRNMESWGKYADSAVEGSRFSLGLTNSFVPLSEGTVIFQSETRRPTGTTGQTARGSNPMPPRGPSASAGVNLTGVPKVIKVQPPLASYGQNRQTTIVIHTTEGDTAQGAISHLRRVGYGYHFIIEKDGTVFYCVSPDRVTAHAGGGGAMGPEGSSVNHYSVGISFVARAGVTPFTGAQMASLNALLATLTSNARTYRWITTHKALTTRRTRSDPGGLFPLNRVNTFGMTWWDGNGLGLI